MARECNPDKAVNNLILALHRGPVLRSEIDSPTHTLRYAQVLLAGWTIKSRMIYRPTRLGFRVRDWVYTIEGAT